MPAALTSDVGAANDIVAVGHLRPAAPSPFPPAVALSPADDQSWCSTCGHPRVDPMTGLLDRWMWARNATMLVDRFGGGCDPITLLLADVDRFKSINDSAGHLAGDVVLASVAEVIRAETRSGDLWGRYGSYVGDEFVGLLPGAGLSCAAGIAERLQRHVAALRIPVATPQGAEVISGVSISIGLATHRSGHSLEDTLGRADLALLAAKRGGRHRIGVTDAQSRVVIAHPGSPDQGNEW